MSCRSSRCVARATSSRLPSSWLAEKPELFRKLVGGTVKFEDFGKLMEGEITETATGTGGPKTVVVK